MSTQPDPPYYQRTRDNRRVHVCTTVGHTRYWLNSGAALWVCERCHPAVGDVAIAMIGEIVETQTERVEL